MLCFACEATGEHVINLLIQHNSIHESLHPLISFDQLDADCCDCPRLLDVLNRDTDR
jgi:hypothetical protein